VTTLSVRQLTRLIGNLHQTLNLQAVRLTGGEPLLYADLVPLIEGVRSLGIRDIKMTTNGYLLERKIDALKCAGLQSINVSLDALDTGCFFRMTKRSGVERVMAGILGAKNAGM